MDWWQSLEGPLPEWLGPVGVKKDGGGSIRGCGKIGSMLLHRAACNHDEKAIADLVAQGSNVNEVEAAGNTPLHNAAYEGWLPGVELLLSLGALVNASNNAGDTPWHWARNMGHVEVMAALEQAGATKQAGKVLVQEHVPKVRDFYQKECWAHHPKPYADFIEFKKKEAQALEAERKKAIRL